MMKTALGILLLVAYTSALPLAFKQGHRYTFQYETEVVHSIPGSASKQIGLHIQCQCHVTIVKVSDPAEAQMKLANVAIARLEVLDGRRNMVPIQADPQGIQMLEANPVEIVFTASGRVKTIRANANDPEWSVNIKKGIANLLQVAPKVEGKDPKQLLVSKTPVVVSQKEQTIVGHCPVTYTIEPWVDQHHLKVHRVTKTIDYQRCADRPSLKESIVIGQLCPACQKTLGYVPYLRHAGHIEHILVNRHLVEAAARETHTFTPFSELAGQVEASARQTLRFMFRRPTISPVQLLQKPRATQLKMKIVHPEQEIKQNPHTRPGIRAKVAELQKSLAQEAQKDISSHAIPKIVAQLVSHLRLCNTPMLAEFVKNSLNQKNQKVRELCFDAASLAATPEFAALLNQIVQQKRTADIPLPLFNRILQNIVFTPEVTAQHVDTVLNLCENVPEFQAKDQLPIRRQCYLSYGALVNRLSQRGPAILQQTGVQTTLTTAVKTLKKKLEHAQNDDEQLCFIKAIGNAGQPEHKKIVLRYLQNPKLAMVVRVECVWALRRMVSRNLRDHLCIQLIQMFQNREQDPELRMAIVELMMDRQPSFLNMQMFLNSAIRETLSKGPRSQQVASWVISKLASMAYYNNPILKERASRARRALSSVRRFVSQTNFGLEYSKAMRIAMYSEKLLSGLELEINKMNVPQSYLPRNMNARLLMHLMGRKFEAIQAGARIEGLQNVIQDLISQFRSRQKRSLWSSVLKLFNSEEPTSPEAPTAAEDDEFSGMPPATPKEQQPPKQPQVSTNTRSIAEVPTGQEFDEFSGMPPPTPKEQQPPKQPQVSTNTRSIAEVPTGQEFDEFSGMPPPTPKKQQPPKQPQAAQPEVSMFMKVFGQEIQYMRITPALLNKLVGQIRELILERKKQIQTAFGAITINKNSLTIDQQITKAFLVAHARQVEPTLTGLPLHLHIMSSLVADIHAKVTVQAQPSLWKFMNANSLKTTVNLRPKISMFTQGFIQVHTPIVRVGVKTQNVVQLKPNMNFNVETQKGASYTFKTNMPTQTTDAFVVSPDPSAPECDGVCGIVEIQQLQAFKIQPTDIPLQITSQNMVQVDQMCYGEKLTGVAACIQGRVPSLSALRFRDVPIFPFLQQTNLRVQFVPKDQVKKMELQVNVDQKQLHQGDIIFRSNGKVKREMTARYNYKPLKNQLVVTVKKIEGLPLYENTDLTVDFVSIRNIQATLNQGPLKWTMASTIDQTGHLMTVQLTWNKLPKQLRKALQKYEPQIIYLLQTFASISRQEKVRKNIEIQFHLLSSLAAQLRVESPLGNVQSKVFTIPVSLRRLPLALKEITQWPYGQCQLQSVKQSGQKRISIFDKLSFSFSAPKSPCQHILVQDRQQKLVKIAVQSQLQGQMDLIVQVQQPQQIVIVVKRDLTVLINNKPYTKNVFQQRGIMIVKKQQAVFVTLNFKHYIQVQYQSTNVKILASPTLRNQLRGLCGDNNGETYQELRSPNNKILSQFDKFAQSWRTQC